MAPKEEGKGKHGLLLVEFKAPKELVDAFDTVLTSRFSNRSEAIRSLMRKFVEAASKKS
jgi:metal-responsive CopG/Arc/MetJ family transcriptional regulator